MAKRAKRKDDTEQVNLAEAIRRRFARFGGVELELPPRELGREPPDFSEDPEEVA